MQKYIAVIAVCVTMLILSVCVVYLMSAEKNDALNVPEAAALKMDTEMGNPLMTKCACNCAHHDHGRVTRDVKTKEETPAKSMGSGKKPDDTKQNKTKL